MKVTLFVFLFGALAAAQQLPEAPAPHFFFDAPNDFLIAGAAAAVSFDGYTTQRVLELGGYEINPIARPFNQTPKYQAWTSGAGFAGMVGGMYLFHHFEKTRPGHARVFRILERTTPSVVTAVELGFGLHNQRIERQLGQ